LSEEARLTEVLEYREVFEETYVFGDLAVEWGRGRQPSVGESLESAAHHFTRRGV
jgi:hypothetical protein